MEKGFEFDFEIVNSTCRPIADELIKKYEELRHIEVDKILFVVNHKSAGSKHTVTLAKTSKIPDKWRDILYQLCSASYFYMIEIYGKTTEVLDNNQKTALIYRELRRIGPEGTIITPDTHDWWQVIEGLGRHWFYPDSTCPDLLEDGVDWKKLMGNRYEKPTTFE